MWRERVIRFFVIALLISLLPLIIILGLIVLPFSGPKKRSVDEVVKFLRAASNNTILPYDWNQFASKPIADKRLDAIRKRAAIAGPPNADKLMMRQLEKEARLLGTEE